MMRVLVTPAVLPPAALAELKDWLGITTTADDASLSTLLATALDVCADFIGLTPIVSTFEEFVPLPTDRRPIPAPEAWQMQAFPADWRNAAVQPGWYGLNTKPVISVISVMGVAADNSRTAFAASQFETRIDADGTCAIRVSDPATFNRAVLRFTAGLAADWASLPVPLRHGIMRLAAHQYRERDTVGSEAVPPASVAALWRPWRRLRLV
jgi:uncharacterized phiE125 gp8 family phage protein